MTPQQREYLKAKSGQPFVLDYILGNNYPTVKWFKRQHNYGCIPDCMLASELLRQDQERQAAAERQDGSDD